MGHAIKVAARRVGPVIVEVAREAMREATTVVAREIIRRVFGGPRRRRRF